MQFGSAVPLSNSAAEPANQEDYAEPETVGWGSTTVGKLLQAKVHFYTQMWHLEDIA